jgi:hypothetical protein
MNNDDDKLTRLERSFVDHALKRYRRGVYRHGYLISWLIVPLTIVVLFVPTMRRYQVALCGGIFFVMYYSLWLTSIRIIGKLAHTVDRGEH